MCCVNTHQAADMSRHMCNLKGLWVLPVAFQLVTPTSSLSTMMFYSTGREWVCLYFTGRKWVCFYSSGREREWVCLYSTGSVCASIWSSVLVLGSITLGPACTHYVIYTQCTQNVPCYATYTELHHGMLSKHSTRWEICVGKPKAFQ